jgi:hypothetical protein
MTARKRPSSAGKPQPLPPAQLSDLEIRVALAFRNFKPDMKNVWAETLERIAAKHQLEIAEARPKHALRLVSGGGA